MRTMAGGARGENDWRMNDHELSSEAAMRRIGAILMMCAMASGLAEGATGAASSQPTTSTPTIRLKLRAADSPDLFLMAALAPLALPPNQGFLQSSSDPFSILTPLPSPSRLAVGHLAEF